MVKGQLDSEMAGEKKKFVEKLKKCRSEVVSELPNKGVPDEVLLRRMKKEGEESAKLAR